MGALDVTPRSRGGRFVVWALLLSAAAACSTSEARTPPSPTNASSPPLPSDGPPTQPAPAPARPAADPIVAPAPAALSPVAAVYPWGPSATAPSDRLDGRFRSPPTGFTRVDVPRGSFGEFLRTLPLQPEGAPVVDYRGNALYDHGRHPAIVAVVDLDIGSDDLQHCADAIVRLHAEWRYGLGDRDLVYRTVSGAPLSYRRYVAGERALFDGKNLVFRRAAAPRKDDHALFRQWLDDVFSWAGTASLERDGQKIASLSDVAAGDFFVMSGAPFGHAVLVLDVARDERGRLALLLGQSYMPAQSFQILARGGSPWFVVEPSDASVSTPFWRPFPATSLRRL